MALFKFTEAIIANKEIKIYNNGQMVRDFTYIDDLVDAILKLMEVIPQGTKTRKQKIKNDSLSSVAPWRVVNIGSSNPVSLMDFISVLENVLERRQKRVFSGNANGRRRNYLCKLSTPETVNKF